MRVHAVASFVVLSLMLNSCRGLSRNFFGVESGEKCEDVQNDLKICSEELAELRTTGKCREPRIVRQRSLCDTYMKRFLNLLLTSVSLKGRHLIDGERVAVVIPLTFTSESLTVLKSFSRDIPHDFSWDHLDESLTTMLEKSPDGRIESRDNNVNDSVAPQTPTHPIVIIVATVGSLVLIILYLVLMEHSLARTIFMGSILIFGLSLGWTWHLEVRKETDRGLVMLRKTVSVPDYCFQSNDDWWSWLIGTNNKDETCRKYHEALMYEPWTRVSFVKVFTLTLSGLFLESLPLLGKRLGQMIFNLNNELGFVPSLFGGITSMLILPPLILFVLASFFTNVFTTSIWALLSHGGSSSSSQPSLPQSPPRQPPPQQSYLSAPCQHQAIASPSWNSLHRKKLHDGAKKKGGCSVVNGPSPQTFLKQPISHAASIRYRNRPRIKLTRSISEPQHSAVD